MRRHRAASLTDDGEEHFAAVDGEHTMGTGLDRSLSDLELVEHVRSGQNWAYSELWQRHRRAGSGAAKRITDRFDADDLTQEAFARVLSAIQGGAGPTEAFRPYLYATIRTVSMSWTRHAVPTTDLDGLDSVADPEAIFEDSSLNRTITGKAFASLLPQWREVLWYTEVEGLKPREVAGLLGMSANAVSALKARASEGLKVAWLQAHVNSDNVDERCREVLPLLGAYNRGKLSAPECDTVQDHITGCLECSILVEEIGNTSKQLAPILLPDVMGTGITTFHTGAGASAAPAAHASIQPILSTLGQAAASATITVANSMLTGAMIVTALAFGVGTFITSHRVLDERHQAHATLVRDQGFVPDGGAPAPTMAELVAPITASAELADRGSVQSAPVVNTTVDTPPVVEPSRPVAVAPVVKPRPQPIADPAPALDPAPASVIEPSPDPAPDPVFLPNPVSVLAIEPSPDPAPDPVSTPVVAAPTIASIADGDFYLPTLSGTATPGHTVLFRNADTGEDLATIVADAGGNWDVTVELPPGQPGVSIVALSRDPGGNLSEPSAPSGPFVTAAPSVSLNEIGVPHTKINITGDPNEVVDVILNGIPTYRALLLSHIPDTGVAIANITVPEGTNLVSVRYANPLTGQFGPASAPIEFTAAASQ